MLKPLLFILALSIIPLSNPEVEVITQDGDSYLVTGRFFISDQSSENSSTAKKAASCVGCQWHLQPICPDPINQPTHLGFDCTDSGSYLCSDNGKRFQVWFLDEGLWRPGDWQLRGSICIGPSGPKAIRELQTEVVQTAVGQLPEIRFDLQPKTNSLVNLPTKVKVKSPNQYQFEVIVAGVTVLVTATATYRYEYANLFSITTTSRDSVYSFRSKGNHPVKVTAYWQAIWSTTAHGTNPVSSPDLTQTLSRTARVLAARGRLIRR